MCTSSHTHTWLRKTHGGEGGETNLKARAVIKEQDTERERVPDLCGRKAMNEFQCMFTLFATIVLTFVYFKY